MPHIELKIEVTNTQEVIKKEKGKWVSLVSRLLSPETRRQKLEEEVYREVLEELKAVLPMRLAEKGIKAQVQLDLKK